MGMEPFSLNIRFAMQAKPALAAMFGRLFLGRFAAPDGVGKIKSLPSVRTPSTSNSRSLIFLARFLDMAGF